MQSSNPDGRGRKHPNPNFALGRACPPARDSQLSSIHAANLPALRQPRIGITLCAVQTALAWSCGLRP